MTATEYASFTELDKHVHGSAAVIGLQQWHYQGCQQH
ncbi:phytoene/squalene synthetase [Saccharothrix tamanrassetensis]|uniref:Phytoene/squalene synthetase n=1 Tax=Saccharothrix tamanrassetensis TaxID=1051531 RepID=A0A841CRP2_9PSEU|nr:phytoene/squalene synthetase [Saccharothrix tamanrassetensis]